MSLPKIEVPVYKVKLNGINKLVKYRPYKVKEEKILLMALESDDRENIFNTIVDLCEECLYDDKIDIKELSLVDLEKLIVSIRARSVGEEVKTNLKCPHCEESTQVAINLEKMKEKKDDNIIDTLMVDEKYGVKLRPPSLKTVGPDAANQTDPIGMITACIDSVYDSETVWKFSDYTSEEKKEFVECLTGETLNKLNTQFMSKLPSNVLEIRYTCPKCNEKVENDLENLIDFFI